MRTVGADHLRAFDKFKEEVFKAKSQELKSRPKPSQATSIPKPSLRSIFPWRTAIRLSVIGLGVYGFYTYREQIFDKMLKESYLSAVDLHALQSLKSDIKLRFVSATNSPSSGTISQSNGSIANRQYFRRLESDYNYLKKALPFHRIKSTESYQFKFWMLTFRNKARIILVNQMGDLVEREQHAFLRVWNWMVFPRKTDTLIEAELKYQAYHNISKRQHQGLKEANPDSQVKANRNAIVDSITANCSKVNIMNTFNENHKDLLIQCQENGAKIGSKIQKLILQRERQYAPNRTTKK